jgi:hypothetical protein
MDEKLDYYFGSNNNPIFADLRSIQEAVLSTGMEMDLISNPTMN